MSAQQETSPGGAGRSRGPRRDRDLLSQRVYAALEEAIITRVHPPGARLVEEEIAVEMGVSRNPVREAFRMLEHAGWIEVTPYAGASVRHPHLDELRDVFELRHQLGRFAAELAAVRATPDQRAALHRLVGEGSAAMERSDAYALAEINWEFHRVLAACANNRSLQRTLDELDKQMRWHFASTGAMRGHESWDEHERIVTAVLAGDAQLAGRLTFEHSRRSEDAFLRRLMPYSGAPEAAVASDTAG